MHEPATLTPAEQQAPNARCAQAIEGAVLPRFLVFHERASEFAADRNHPRAEELRAATTATHVRRFSGLHLLVDVPDGDVAGELRDLSVMDGRAVAARSKRRTDV